MAGSVKIAGARDPAGWSGWTPVDGLPPTTPEVLAEVLDGGQAFRWRRQLDGAWLGQWGPHVARLRVGGGGYVEWSGPRDQARGTRAALADYLATGTDYAALSDALPWRSDPHLRRCLEAFPGLRLLRQPFGETLLGFLCSATKQIVQIKQMVGLLAERLGDVAYEANGVRFHRLPTWEQLARVPETELRKCLLGFRARYIAETARRLHEQPGWLEQTESLPYPEAKARLCSLPGVGEKVADCVLLFGAGRLEAFPVDVWILKTMANRYGLPDWKPAQLVRFGRVHFGEHAGLAQQFLFAWERRVGARQARA